MAWDTDLDITDQIEDIEDFLVVEDLDLADETELRRVIANIESLLNSSNSGANIGLRVSVLTSEQWRTVLNRTLAPSLKKGGADRFIHTLRDPNDKSHLLVSPSVVAGINEGSKIMYQELVYAALRCIPTDLPKPLQLGLNDILASAVAKKIKVNLFCKNHPHELEVVMGLLKTLSHQYGYKPLDWGLVMRRRPERFFLALKNSLFFKEWEDLSNEKNLNYSRNQLLEILTAEQINWRNPAVELLPTALNKANRKRGKSS